MKSPLSTGMAAIAVAALVAIPLIAAGPALADDIPVETPDTTGPVVASNWDVPVGTWSKRNSMRLTATDTGSGINSIYVDYDGRTQQWNAETADVVLVQGSQMLEYWAVDNAGNESGHSIIRLNLDHDFPQIQADSEILNDVLSPVEVIQGSIVPFTYTCTDGFSGVRQCDSAHTSGSALPTSELGEHGFSVDAIDYADNRTTRTFSYVVVAADEPIDETPPVFTSTTPATDEVYVGQGDEFIDFSCADPESGIASCVLVDHDGNEVAVGAPLDLAEGDYTWTGIAVNALGFRTTRVVRFSVQGPDTTEPLVDSDWDVPTGQWSKRDSLRLTATDSGSGISAIHVDYNGQTRLWNAETADVELVQGSQVLEYWAVDEAGNESEHSIIGLNIDRDLPTIQVDSEIAPTGLAPVEVIQGSTVPFSFTCTDELSGVQLCTSAKESGRALPTDELGAYAFTVDAFDNAGNRTTRLFRYTVVTAIEPADSPAGGNAGLPVSGDKLAFTGMEPGWLPAIAIALVVLGAGLVVLQRRATRAGTS